MKSILAGALVGLLLAASAETVDRSAAEVVRHRFFELRPETRFELECTALTDTPRTDSTVYVADASGAVYLSFSSNKRDFDIRSGDRLRVSGSIRVDTKLLRDDAPNRTNDFVSAWCDSVTRISSGGPTQAIPSISGAELASGRFDCHPVFLRGTVLDAFADEIDVRFTYLVLNGDGTVVYATSPRFEIPPSLIGQSVSICGRITPRSKGARQFLGRTLEFAGTNAVTVLAPTRVNSFDVPVLHTRDVFRPSDITAMGLRRVEGTVLATWRPGKFLLLTDDGHRIRIELSRQNLPPCGSSVEAVGIVETDLFDLTFCRASWRPSVRSPLPDEPVLDATRNTFFDSCISGTLPSLRYYGRAVRLTGVVRHLPSEDQGEQSIVIESEGRLVPIDISMNASVTNGVQIGSLLDVTGICIHEFEVWRRPSVFPHVNCYRLVTRTPNDIRTLAQPPWWTPSRLLVVIGTLLAVLIGFLIWNRALQRLVERRGAEIARSEIARVESDLKVYERTRLAVELHDSVAQNLTGVSMEIRAAKRALAENPARLTRHLDLATLSLDSCREELRNCLWDLRNLTLEERTVDEAIRKTLQQHLGNIDLAVRFNVPREAFSDNMIHTVLRIIRELVINSVRHGKATDIKVAGSLDGNRLLFSVRDNGCGFDPHAVPGMEEGHFGLQGIRDRIDLFNGERTLDSSPSSGTRTTIVLELPNDTESDTP